MDYLITHLLSENLVFGSQQWSHGLTPSVWFAVRETVEQYD